MASSYEETSSTSSSESQSESSSSSEGNDSKNGLSKRDLFLSTYRRHQNWSLPESIVYYVAMNPKNAAVYEKLIQSCKYFFVQNPIIVVNTFAHDPVHGKWIPFVFKDGESSRFSNVSSKFWVTDEFYHFLIRSNHNMVSSILPKFYRVDVKKLKISAQNISFNDFLFLTSNVTRLEFDNNTVMNADGSAVPFQKLFALLPNVHYIKFFIADSSCITANTVKELLENPHLSNLIYFEVCNLSELFDIETFMKFMKKTRDTLFDLHFCPPLSEAFKNRLDEMIDEILESKTCNMKLDFHGLDEEKRKKIESLYERF